MSRGRMIVACDRMVMVDVLRSGQILNIFRRKGSQNLVMD